MARRGRKRNVEAKRDKSGKVLRPSKRVEREARVKPTPELARHKGRIGGKEVEDPLSYLHMEAGCIEALAQYRRQKRAAGFSCGSLVANVDDTARLKADEEMADADALLRRGRFEAAAGALVLHSRGAYEVVQDFCGAWGGEWTGCVSVLRDGALALADHYHIVVEPLEDEEAA